MHLVGPAGDALTARASVPFGRLAGVPLVLPGPPSGLRAILEGLAARRKIRLHVALEADALSLQKSIVAEGDAYTVLAFQAVHGEVEAGRLQAARITQPVIERTIALAATRARPLTLAAREVLRLVRRTIEQMPAVDDRVR
jgi:DNA-binding transcriptional LysR family regulator